MSTRSPDLTSNSSTALRPLALPARRSLSIEIASTKAQRAISLSHMVFSTLPTGRFTVEPSPPSSTASTVGSSMMNKPQGSLPYTAV